MDDSHHEINYKKSPFVLYDKFFNSKICDRILKFAEIQQYKKYNDRKSRFEYIILNDSYDYKDLKWITNPLTDLIEESNDINFQLDVTSLRFLSLYKFHIDDELYWHHDCDWWFNSLPYDKKLTLLISLSDESEYEGGEIGEFMSTVPLPREHYSKGSVTIIPSYYYYCYHKITQGIKKLLVCNVIGPKFR